MLRLERDGASEENRRINEESVGASEKKTATFLMWGVVLTGSVIAAGAIWYSAELLKADIYLKDAYSSAAAGDSSGVIRQGRRAAKAPDVSGELSFAYARVLTLAYERLKSFDPRQDEEKSQLIDLAINHASKSMDDSLIPDSHYLLLAYLSYLKSDFEQTRRYAQEAIRLDPYFANSRWLLAESLIAEGDNRQALADVRFALKINPGLPEARALLNRLRRNAKAITLDELMRKGLFVLEDGRPKKARKIFIRALRKSGGNCFECHRGLALCYESESLYEDAIREWEDCLRKLPEGRSTGEIDQRLRSLRQKASG